MAAGLGPFGWVAVLSFGGLGFALLMVLWPRPERQDATLPSRLIEMDIEVADPLPIELIRRDIALQLENVYRENTVLYEQLARSFRLAAVLLHVEVLAWVIDLATKA